MDEKAASSQGDFLSHGRPAQDTAKRLVFMRVFAASVTLALGPLQLSASHHSTTGTVLNACYKTRHLPFLLIFSSQQLGLQALSLGALIEGEVFLKKTEEK